MQRGKRLDLERGGGPAERLPQAVITHCGAEIRCMAEDRGVAAQIAYDGMEVVLR